MRLTASFALQLFCQEQQQNHLEDVFLCQTEVEEGQENWAKTRSWIDQFLDQQEDQEEEGVQKNAAVVEARDGLTVVYFEQSSDELEELYRFIDFEVFLAYQYYLFQDETFEITIFSS